VGGAEQEVPPQPQAARGRRGRRRRAGDGRHLRRSRRSWWRWGPRLVRRLLCEGLILGEGVHEVELVASLAAGLGFIWGERKTKAAALTKLKKMRTKKGRRSRKSQSTSSVSPGGWVPHPSPPLGLGNTALLAGRAAGAREKSESECGRRRDGERWWLRASRVGPGIFPWGGSGTGQRGVPILGKRDVRLGVPILARTGGKARGARRDICALVSVFSLRLVVFWWLVSSSSTATPAEEASRAIVVLCCPEKTWTLIATGLRSDIDGTFLCV
jgi:hypothetical protein